MVLKKEYINKDKSLSRSQTGQDQVEEVSSELEGIQPFQRIKSEQYNTYMVQGSIDSNIKKISSKRKRNLEENSNNS